MAIPGIVLCHAHMEYDAGPWGMEWRAVAKWVVIRIESAPPMNCAVATGIAGAPEKPV